MVVTGSCRPGHSIDRVDSFTKFGPCLAARSKSILEKPASFFFLCASAHMSTYRLTCNFLNIFSSTISVKFAKNSLIIGRLALL